MLQTKYIFIRCSIRLFSTHRSFSSLLLHSALRYIWVLLWRTLTSITSLASVSLFILLVKFEKLSIYLQHWTFTMYLYWVPTILKRTTSVSRWIPTFGQLLMNFLILMDLQLWRKEWEYRGCSLSSYSTTQWHSYRLVSISRCMAAACTTQHICYS